MEVDYTTTKEGKLLFAAVSLLMNEGPTKGKTEPEIIELLAYAVKMMEKM